MIPSRPRTSAHALGLLLLAGCRSPNVADENVGSPPTSPEIAISPANPTTTDALEVSLTAPSTDPDGDSVSYRYAWYLDEEAAADLAEDTVSAERTAKGQTWRVVVTPTDGRLDGQPAEAQVLISNTPPSVSLTAASDSPTSAEDLEVLIEVEDPDGDEVSLSTTWASDGGASVDADTVLAAEWTKRGDIWTVTVLASDEEEAGAPGSLSFLVGNAPPVIASISLSPDPLHEGDTLQAQVEVGDEDEDEITLSLSWSVDGVEVQTGTSQELSSDLFDHGAEISLVVVPSDPTESGEAASAGPLTVADTAPVLEGVSLDPAEIYEATTVTCVPGVVSDADGDAVSYDWSWTVNGADAGSAETLDGSAFDKGDLVACTATPTDGMEAGDAVTSEEIEVSNTPPVLSGATLSSTSPAEGDTLSVTLGATSDDDGDTVTVRYSWVVDGVAVGTGSTLTSASFSKDQEIYVELTPDDGADLGATVTSSVATAVNTLPSVTSIAFSSSTVYTDDVLKTTVSTTDADGDSVSLGYAWYVDGTLVSPTASSLKGANWFDRDQEVYVVVTPDDGDGAGAASTSSVVTISNSPPEAPTVAISGKRDADDLVCEVSVDATDADEDAVTYTVDWEVDGVAFTGAGTTTETGDTVSADDTTEGERWTCTVTPDDGTDTGTAGDDSVKIVSDTCSSLDFDGTNDYIYVADDNALDLRTSFTVAAWVIYDDGALRTIVGKGKDGTSTHAWQLTTDLSGYPRIALNGTGNPNATASSVFTAGVWTHVAATYDGATLTLYIDGVSVATTATTVDPGNQASDLTIARWPNSNSYTDATISDVVLFDDPLSATEVATLYSDGVDETDSRLAAWWPLDEGTGTTAYDQSVNGNDGTISGGATWTEDCP